MDPLLSLGVASAFFVGSHFAMSHPLRAPMVSVLSEGGFQGVYSLVSAGAMIWMYFAFKATPAGAPVWGSYGDAVWVVGSLIALVGMVLLAGSFIRNPALAMPGAEKAAAAGPHGVFHVTRHPMMWGFSLWAISHIIAAPTPRTLIVASTILVLALVGSRLQDAKKEKLMGDAWKGWEAKTSYWPRFGKLVSAGWVPWIGGIAIWLAASWAHLPLGGIAAGVFRWI